LATVTTQKLALPEAHLAAGYQALLFDVSPCDFTTERCLTVPFLPFGSSKVPDLLAACLDWLQFALSFAPRFKIAIEVTAVLALSNTDLMNNRVSKIVTQIDLFSCY
jgi:hypothetical protein